MYYVSQFYEIFVFYHHAPGFTMYSMAFQQSAEKLTPLKYTYNENYVHPPRFPSEQVENTSSPPSLPPITTSMRSQLRSNVNTTTPTNRPRRNSIGSSEALL